MVFLFLVLLMFPRFRQVQQSGVDHRGGRCEALRRYTLHSRRGVTASFLDAAGGGIVLDDLHCCLSTSVNVILLLLGSQAW